MPQGGQDETVKAQADGAEVALRAPGDHALYERAD